MSTRYNTGNPIESTDVRDMSDNAKNFDQFSNSMSDSFTDRLGRDRQTIEGSIRKAGFQPASLDFVTGGTLFSGDRNKAVFNPAPSGDNNWYAWQGAFPKIISPNSTPANSGGFGNSAWKPVTNNALAPQLRESTRRSYAEAGYNLVEGSFQTGFTLVDATDVALDEVSGKAFSGTAGTYQAGTDPSGVLFTDVSGFTGGDDTIDVRTFGLLDGGLITAAIIADVSLHCRVNRKKGVLRGTYTMEEDIVIDFNFDGTNATITTDNTCIIGRNTNFVRDNIDVIAPRMVAKTLRPAVTETVGVKITSITNSKIRVPYSKGFTKPMQVVAYGAPVAFNEISIGKLDDGFLNFAIETLVYTPDPAYKSYVNENLFIGGNFSMEPSATNDPNRAQFYANDRDAGINGNYWLKPCLEFPTYGTGQPASKFLVAKSKFSENFIIGARTEGVGTIEFEGNSSNNFISLGSQSDPSNVQVLETGGSSGNEVKRIGKYGEARGVQRPIALTNLLSEDRPIFDFIAPIGAGGVQNRVGTETTYSTRYLHDGAAYKRTADTVPRLEISARAPTGMKLSRGTGVASNASSSFSVATNALANGSLYVVNPTQVPVNLVQSASGLILVEIRVIAHRSSDGKRAIGTLIAIVQYTTGGANYTLVGEDFETKYSDFSTMNVSLGDGVEKGSVISPRVVFTDSTTAGSIKVEMLVTMSASSSISN